MLQFKILNTGSRVNTLFTKSTVSYHKCLEAEEVLILMAVDESNNGNLGEICFISLIHMAPVTALKNLTEISLVSGHG